MKVDERLKEVTRQNLKGYKGKILKIYEGNKMKNLRR